MPGKSKQYSAEFREQAAKKVVDTPLPIVKVARELGINESTLGFCGCAANARRSSGVVRRSNRGAVRKMGNCWLPGVALRGEASSRLMLRWLKTVVVSDEEKARHGRGWHGCRPSCRIRARTSSRPA